MKTKMPYLFKAEGLEEGVEVNILSVNAYKVSEHGKVVFTLNDKPVEKVETRQSKYIDENGNDVTERKPEFKCVEQMADGTLRDMSTTRSNTVNVAYEKPWNLLAKNMIPKGSTNFWLLKPSERGAKPIVAARKRRLYELAEKYVRDGLAGLGSLSWGN